MKTSGQALANSSVAHSVSRSSPSRILPIVQQCSKIFSRISPHVRDQVTRSSCNSRTTAPKLCRLRCLKLQNHRSKVLSSEMPRASEPPLQSLVDWPVQLQNHRSEVLPWKIPESRIAACPGSFPSRSEPRLRYHESGRLLEAYFHVRLTSSYFPATVLWLR